jgi:phosphonate transport system substrate-binding protein
MKQLLSMALAAALAFAGSAQAEFALDSRYSDADGDLIADIPTDASQLVDPDTLIFAVYAKAWSDFLTHMEKVTGKKVQFFPVQSNAAQIEAMRAGRLHIAGFNTGSNPLPARVSKRSRTSRARRWRSLPRLRIPASRHPRPS